MPEEVIETYSTKVEPQKELEIDYKDSGFEDVIDETGVIPTTLNVPVMVQRMAKDIYKNASSGIRELYMNAVRGCADGVELFGYKNPHVTVTINEQEKIITILDNGRGITKARFKQVLRELGTSDNFSGKTTGQFGMGFASYMTLASVVVLDTIGNNGDNYKMLCRDGTSSKYAGKSDLDGHGVKLTLTCYDNVDFEEVCEKLYDTARHASVPTTVIIEDFEYCPANFQRGTNEIEQVRFDDNVEEGSIRIDHEDFTLIASDSVDHNEESVYLLNVPIDSDIQVPFNYWVLNIKDERKYQPMPDRDRMREESDEALGAHIKDALKKHFQDLKIANYTEYITSDRRQEFLWLIDNPDYAPENMQPLLRNLKRCISLREVSYTDKNAYAHSLTYWLRAAGNGGITYQGYKNKAYTDKVRQYIEKDCQLLIAKKSKDSDWANSVEILEQFGVPTVKQILKDNKVKMPKRAQGDGSDKMVVSHSHERSYETEDTFVEEVGVESVRADPTIKMSKLISFVREYPSGMKIVRNDPALKDTDCQVFSEWIKAFASVEVLTNRGLIKADLLAREEEIAYCTDLEESFLPLIEGMDKLLILDNTKVLGVALLREEYQPERYIGGLVDRVWLDSFIREKYGSDLYGDDSKKFFCDNVKDIKPEYHELFAKVIRHISSNYADTVAETQMQKYLAIIKEYEVLETDDDISKLKFYYAKWQNLPNKRAGITSIFDKLVEKSKITVHDNQYLLTKFAQEDVLRKAFGAVEVKKCQMNMEHYSKDTFQVAFTTNLRTLAFKEDLRVYGMEVQLADIKIRIFKSHCLITGELRLTT